jgi:hypothetical protein
MPDGASLMDKLQQRFGCAESVDLTNNLALLCSKERESGVALAVLVFVVAPCITVNASAAV